MSGANFLDKVANIYRRHEPSQSSRPVQILRKSKETNLLELDHDELNSVLNFFLENKGYENPSWIGEADKKLEGFQWSGGDDPQTIGIWMWSKPLIVKKDGKEALTFLIRDWTEEDICPCGEEGDKKESTVEGSLSRMRHELHSNFDWGKCCLMPPPGRDVEGITFRRKFAENVIELPCKLEKLYMKLSEDEEWRNCKNIKLINIIGSGNFGAVWKGRFGGTKTDAVKVLTVGTMAPHKFLAEARALQQLQHPNVVEFYQVVKTEPTWIVTEYMENVNLRDWWRNEHIKIARQMIDDMTFIAEKNCIHCDIRPANLPLNGYQFIKIADFGIGRTRKWAAPEVIKFRTFSTESDIYSLGVHLYCILTNGKVPYGDMDNRDGFTERLTEFCDLMANPNNLILNKDLIGHGLIENSVANFAAMKKNESGLLAATSYEQIKQDNEASEVFYGTTATVEEIEKKMDEAPRDGYFSPEQFKTSYKKISNETVVFLGEGVQKESFEIEERQWEHIAGPEAASPFKPLGRSEFPEPFGKESTDGKKGRGKAIVGNLLSAAYSLNQIDGEGKRKSEEFVNGNDIVSCKSVGHLFGTLKAEAIYEMTKREGNEWTAFVTNNLGISAKKLRVIRGEIGSLTMQLKMESLKYWREKNGSNRADLVGLVGKFVRCIEVPSDIENIPFENICRAVVGLISDESWMRFVRIELGLTEDEIKELRMEYADFTEEQKFQIIKRWIQHKKGYTTVVQTVDEANVIIKPDNTAVAFSKQRNWCLKSKFLALEIALMKMRRDRLKIRDRDLQHEAHEDMKL